MRIVACLILFLFVGLFTQAQYSGDYEFSTYFSTFNPISGGTDLDTIESSYEVSHSFAIGFTFYFESQPYTHVKAVSHGILLFDTSKTTAFAPDLSHGNHRPSVSPMMGFLLGYEPGCQASYKTTGTSPNRIFTMEWLNWQLDKKTPRYHFK